MLLNVFVNYGFHLSGPREVALNANDKFQLGTIFFKNTFSRFFLASAICLLILMLTRFTSAFEHYEIILLLSTILLFSEALFPSWFAQGLERMPGISVANLCSKIIYLSLILIAIKKPEDSKWVNFSMGISALTVNTILIGYIVIKWNIPFIQPRLKDIFISLKRNFLLFSSALISHISISSGVIILSFFASKTELGLYGLAERIMFVLRMFPVLIIQSIYPNASKLYQQNRDAFYVFLRKVYLSTIGASLVISVSTTLLAPWIIFLLSGEFRDEAAKILRLLALIPFLASLNIANMILVLVSGSNKLLFRATSISTILMLTICISLTWLYAGTGLAIGIIITEILIFIIQLKLNLSALTNETRNFYKHTFSSHYSG